jgi:hypothetical protein
MPTVSIKFRADYGDHAAGATVQLPEGMARHLVDCGLATFVATPEPVELPVERAVATPDDSVERADGPRRGRRPAN